MGERSLFYPLSIYKIFIIKTSHVALAVWPRLAVNCGLHTPTWNYQFFCLRLRLLSAGLGFSLSEWWGTTFQELRTHPSSLSYAPAKVSLSTH